jgi:hypothetical protein
MSQANAFTLLAAFVAAAGAIMVAVLTYWLTRKKMVSEIKFIMAQQKLTGVQTEKLQRELSVVTYKLAASSERTIYDSTGVNDLGFDFKGREAQIWERGPDGIDRAVSNYGLGVLKSEKGVLDIVRTNTDGRFEIWLRSYGSDGASIIPSRLISGQRRIRVSFEAKAIGASHKLRIVWKEREGAGPWLDHDSTTISPSNTWTPIKSYFLLPPDKECRMRIDDLEISNAPSSVQIRNVIVAERTVDDFADRQQSIKSSPIS